MNWHQQTHFSTKQDRHLGTYLVPMAMSETRQSQHPLMILFKFIVVLLGVSLLIVLINISNNKHVTKHHTEYSAPYPITTATMASSQTITSQ